MHVVCVLLWMHLLCWSYSRVFMWWDIRMWNSVYYMLKNVWCSSHDIMRSCVWQGHQLLLVLKSQNNIQHKLRFRQNEVTWNPRWCCIWCPLWVFLNWLHASKPFISQLYRVYLLNSCRDCWSPSCPCFDVFSLLKFKNGIHLMRHETVCFMGILRMASNLMIHMNKDC